MKKIIKKLLLISILGLTFSNVNAFGPADTTQCMVHGELYKVVFGNQQCPLVIVPGHEEGHEHLPESTMSSNEMVNNSQDPIKNRVAKSMNSKSSMVDTYVELYTVLIHSNHCYSSHPGHI